MKNPLNLSISPTDMLILLAVGAAGVVLWRGANVIGGVVDSVKATVKEVADATINTAKVAVEPLGNTLNKTNTPDLDQYQIDWLNTVAMGNMGA